MPGEVVNHQLVPKNGNVLNHIKVTSTHIYKTPKEGHITTQCVPATRTNFKGMPLVK